LPVLKGGGVVQAGSGANDDQSSPPRPRVFTADPRKFSEYVLVPEQERSKGKHHIFLGLFGYRPRNVEDAQALAVIYVAQAQERFAAGEYVMGKRDHHGQRYTIAIELKGVAILSGWLLRSDDVLWLTTPFAGFVRLSRQEG
jgi:hypothetical protein